MVGVSSRFVSESELASRPSSSTADYDPRSLFEQLQAHKQAKDAELDDKFKLSNQFRGLDQDESDFLAQANAQKRQDETLRVQREKEELEAFRAAQAKQSPPLPLPGNTAREQGSAAPSGSEKKAKETKEVVGEKSKSEAVTTTKSATAPKKRKATSTLGIVKKKPAKASASNSNTDKAQPEKKGTS